MSASLKSILEDALKKARTKKPRYGYAYPWINNDSIREAAKNVIDHKGMPYSQSDFNAAYSNAWNWIKKMGATKRQMNLFKKLVDEAPIKSGRFNCYSGD